MQARLHVRLEERLPAAHGLGACGGGHAVGGRQGAGGVRGGALFLMFLARLA